MRRALLILPFLLTACATMPPQSASRLTNAIPTVAASAIPYSPPAATINAAPPIASTPVPPQAVYVNPKLVKVSLAPHIDHNGNLIGRTDLYEVVTPGHFNVSALQNPDNAFIPTEDAIIPPGLANPATLPAMHEAAAHEPGHLPLDTIDPADVTITGLLASDSNRDQAEGMAKAADKVAYYDPDLGWVLLPKSAFRSGVITNSAQP